MPDLFHGDPVPLDRSENYDLNVWLNGPPGHPPARVDPVVQSVLKYLEEELKCERIAGVGYCFGAKYVVRNMLSNGPLRVGYICTPSLIEVEELNRVEAPLSIAAAENDSVFPQEKRVETECILRDKLSIPYQINLYGRVEHGFGCKANIAIKESKFAKEQAFIQAVTWLDEHLRNV